MAITTVNDVVQQAKEFEKRLADLYKRISAKSTQEGARMLADYMSRHRQRINRALSRLSSGKVERILSTPLQYEPENTACRSFDNIDLSPDADAKEIIDAAVAFDQCLVEFYRQVADQTVDQDVRELFENLILWEEDDEIQLKKMKAMDYF
jgi:rubrerythrin